MALRDEATDALLDESESAAKLLAILPGYQECPTPGIPQWAWNEALQKVTNEATIAAGLAGPFDEIEPNRQYASIQFGDRCTLILAEALVAFLAKYCREQDTIAPTMASLLSPREWEVVALVCNRRMDLPEAADELGMAVGTARKHFDEAARKLNMSVKELRRRRLEVAP